MELGFDIFVHRYSYAKIGVLHDTPPGETCTLLSCQPEIDRFTTSILVTEFSHGLAVRFIPAFYEIVNVEQQLAFRCFIGREQCEQAFVIRFFIKPAANKSTVKLALNQLYPDTSP